MMEPKTNKPTIRKFKAGDKITVFKITKFESTVERVLMGLNKKPMLLKINTANSLTAESYYEIDDKCIFHVHNLDIGLISPNQE